MPRAADLSNSIVVERRYASLHALLHMSAETERSMLNRFLRLIAIVVSLRALWRSLRFFFETDGVALHGYDPVAYFVAAAPQKDKRNTYEYIPSSIS